MIFKISSPGTSILLSRRTRRRNTVGHLFGPPKNLQIISSWPGPTAKQSIRLVGLNSEPTRRMKQVIAFA